MVMVLSHFAFSRCHGRTEKIRKAAEHHSCWLSGAMQINRVNDILETGHALFRFPGCSESERILRRDNDWHLGQPLEFKLVDPLKFPD